MRPSFSGAAGVSCAYIGTSSAAEIARLNSAFFICFLLSGPHDHLHHCKGGPANGVFLYLDKFILKFAYDWCKANSLGGIRCGLQNVRKPTFHVAEEQSAHNKGRYSISGGDRQVAWVGEL